MVKVISQFNQAKDSDSRGRLFRRAATTHCIVSGSLHGLIYIRAQISCCAGLSKRTSKPRARANGQLTDPNL